MVEVEKKKSNTYELLLGYLEGRILYMAGYGHESHDEHITKL